MNTGNQYSRRQRSVRHHWRTSIMAVIPVIVAVVVVGYGCAYFNTFYNAKKIYTEAQNIPRDPDGNPNRGVLAKYDEVIGKCEDLIATYPDSKWVDDAILMIGKCHFEKAEYNEAIERLEQLEAAYPDSELMREARLYLGKSYAAKDDAEGAIPILKGALEAKKKDSFTPELLFLLGTNSIKINNDDEAMTYLAVLAEDYPRSKYRINADLEIADLFMDRGEYDKALAVYEKLLQAKLKEDDEIRFLMRLAEVYVQVERYDKALETTTALDKFVLKPQLQAEKMLIVAKAHAAKGSIGPAVDTYLSVGARFPNSKFGAEAAFHLGVIYQEEMDSLAIAKGKFDEVPREYANSPFSKEAIKRSSSITKLLKLRESLELGTADEEGKAAVQFDVAEVELFQLGNFQKALVAYQAFLTQYPQSELAPRAAYAVSYIYDVHMQDKLKAKDAYQHLVSAYPDSQQAQYARKILEREFDVRSDPVKTDDDSEPVVESKRE